MASVESRYFRLSEEARAEVDDEATRGCEECISDSNLSWNVQSYAELSLLQKGVTQYSVLSA